MKTKIKIEKINTSKKEIFEKICKTSKSLAEASKEKRHKLPITSRKKKYTIDPAEIKR